ncbi:4-hydroxy-tetrahydrodipicolinate reductase [Canibacter zhoujuaniae]|uniref:4-hydroxy-tetrahydrodipicolinate reductase n=1 Tax=Canibacter zhoujuaniae TaxID=2708343 RepID=UPI0014212D63|nr:4-hydroxy-tetrahydrodipicolinate reductase [Canibacter zhoujuaniae]
MTKVVIAGGRGRLGSLITEIVEKEAGFELAASLGRQATAEEYAAGDILIDVTNYEVSKEIVFAALERGQRVLVGTSGWQQEALTELQEHALECGSAVTVIPNFSLGSVLGSALATLAAPYFESVEIVETHHAAKVDSPSGTAIRTAEMVGAARSKSSIKAAHTQAAFVDQEARGQQVAGVPVHAIRQHGILATQEVRFGGTGESLEIVHRTFSKESYRAGVVAALKALQTQDPGLIVGLDRVLGLEFAN